MTNSAAQIDDSWEAPQVIADAPYMQANNSLRPFLAVSRAPKVREAVSLNVLGTEVNWIPDGREFPPAVWKAIESLYSFSELEEGWDSYGARAFDPIIVGPVLKLVFATHQKGHCPRLVPLSNGGVGLRWSSQASEIEADLSVDGSIEIVIDGDALAEPQEIETNNIETARQLIESAL